jgi:hypothetical protein
MFTNKDDYGHCHHRHPLSHNVRAGFAIFVVDIKYLFSISRRWIFFKKLVLPKVMQFR